MQDAWLTVLEWCCVIPVPTAAPPGLDSMQGDLQVFHEWMKDPCCIRSTTHAGNHQIRKSADLFQALLATFRPDDRLEIPHDRGKWMRSDRFLA